MPRTHRFARALPAALCLFLTFAFASGQELGENILRNFTFRNLGPNRVGAMMRDIAVPDSPPKAHLYTFYVAALNGGVWKTTNNGTTFEPVFEGQTRLTIGDIALAPSNPEHLWVGTGANYPGDGVYKSEDGGKTWKNMGLKDSHQISKIVIHPKNPDIVYVAAMGHPYAKTGDRGVYKSTNGGRTWERVLYINDVVGVIDLAMNPARPEILYAATYDKQKLPWLWMFERGGPDSAIFRTTDGGKTWTRLAGGLPGGKIGRISFDVYLKNPDVVYAVIDNANKRPPTKKEIEQDETRGLKPQDRDIGGQCFRTDDGGTTWTRVNPDAVNVLSKGPGQIKVDPNDDKKLFIQGVALSNSTDGGKTWADLDWPPKRLFSKMFGDIRAHWIDPQNSDRIILGTDGGVFVSYDGGKTCDHYYNLPLGEFYAVGVDMDDPYNIYGGLQDHEMWKGPSNGPAGNITYFDWTAIGNGDGMYTVVDPTDSRWVYTTMQNGGHFRVDQKLGYRTSIAPQRGRGKPPYRFIWCAPIQLSPHNSRILYAGAQLLLRSMDRGDHWQEISPDLTTYDPVKMAGSERQGGSNFTITTISESPVTPGTIWVGTGDGRVQVTKDDGASWTDVTKNVAAAGGPEEFYVTRVFASRYDPAKAYVVKSGHRYDDFRPFVFQTENGGVTWTPLAANLPNQPVEVIFEDWKNPNLLFLGNHIGVYVSIDGGKAWARLKNNMPNVPVLDLVVHPRENDLVVGSYGRGLFVTDITPLQELDDKVLAEDVHLFAVEPKAQRVAWAFGANDYLFGDRQLQTPNEPNGIVIHYYLRSKPEDKVRLTVTDPFGKELAALDATGDPGINSILWDMRPAEAKPQGTAPRAVARGRDATSQWVPPGEYVVVLEAAGKRLTGKARITERTGWAIPPFPELIRRRP